MSRSVGIRLNQDLGAVRSATKERLDALIVERQGRIAADPDLYSHPDDRDRELVWQIWALRHEFISLEAQYQSLRGEYLFIGCYSGEHKKRRRLITRNGAQLVYGCACHGGAK